MLSTLIIILIASWLVGVRLYNIIIVDEQSARISSTIESFHDLVRGRTASDISQAAHFAVLSSQVYGNPNSEGVFQGKWDISDCDYHRILSQWKQLSLPESLPNKPENSTANQARLDSKLVFGVWYRKTSDSTVDVVIAFRGTEDPGDFWSNFRWITRFFSKGWDQYDMARTIAIPLEKYITEYFSNKTTRIIATGHSLGGGLAHQAAYASSKIKTVYAFDSSSVTGFYDVEPHRREQSSCGMRIYRIHERGEILSYLRKFMSIIYPVAEKNPQIIEITYNFDKGGAVGQHSIQKLACALIKANGGAELGLD